MKLKNYTPHEINVYGNGFYTSIKTEVEGGIRVSEKATPLRSLFIIDGLEIDVVTKQYGVVEGLPEQEEGVYLIVSLMVAQALKSQGIIRSDIISPDTGPGSVIRDEDGHIKGVKRFQKV